MVRSLWTAASGMTGQQYNVDTIANNLSNVNTVGYKRQRAEFEDLLYITTKQAGTPATEQTVVPTPSQVGHGTRVSSTQRMFTQGAPRETGTATDFAMFGEGFFRVLLRDGSFGYTRNGEFKIDSNKQLVTNQGFRVLPELVLPENAVADSLTVGENGRISITTHDGNDLDLGQMQVHRFVNPAGLNAVGENIFKISAASGEAIGGFPGDNGFGAIKQRFLESSNVEIAKEMVNMIVAQRAYEMNSKAIQTSDTMLGIANNLKR